MVVKRKDFQKAAAFIHEFLLKLTDDSQCAEVRDSLKLALLHMQKYYRVLQSRSSERNTHHTLQLTARGLSPMTPHVDTPDRFQWKWFNMDTYVRMATNMSMADSVNFASLPAIIDATLNDDIEAIEELIRRDPSCLDDRDGIGRTALSYAAHFFKHEPLQYILDNQADPNSTAHDGSTALHQACHDGNAHAVKLLLEAGSDISIVDVHGKSATHWAVTTPEIHCLQILLENNADAGVRDKDGLSASMWACQMDHIKHFELLSRAEYSNVKDTDGIERDLVGKTWMHWAVRRNEPLECLQTLLTADSARIKDEDGKTVLLLASEMGSLPSCQVILEIAGTDCINDYDNEGRSSLHLATVGGHGDVVNYLLENGADIMLTDKHEATAWEYARNRQLHYCQLIFMSHQRQRIKSNPTSPMPNGHGLFNENFSYEEYENGESTNRSKPTTPLTPPHPPKRPRTSSRGFNRRSNSMTSPEKETYEWPNERAVVSANDTRKKEKIEVNANPHQVVNGAFNARDETAMVTDDQDGGPIEYVDEEEVDEVSVGEMDISDMEDNNNSRDNRPPPTRRGPHERSPQHRPHPPPRVRNQQLPSGGPQRSQELISNSQECMNSTEEEEFIQISNPDRPAPVPRPPPSAVYRSGRNGPIPSPPNSTPQRPQALRQPQPLPRTNLPKESTLPSARPTSGPSYREQVSSPPMIASVDQINTRSNQPVPPVDINRPGSGQKPPGVLEGRRIHVPPPMLTPLENAPRLPPTDSFDKINKKKRRSKKREKDKEAGCTSPQNPLDIPPPRGFAAPLHPPQQNRLTSAIPPPPRYSKGTPLHSESRYIDDNLYEEKLTSVNGDLPNSSSFQLMDSEEHVSNHDEEDENEALGSLIPPPQAFRNTGPQGRPLSQSVPQDNRVAKMPPTSAKPPLPRARNSASVHRPPVAKPPTARRTRPITSRSTKS